VNPSTARKRERKEGKGRKKTRKETKQEKEGAGGKRRGEEKQNFGLTGSLCVLWE
jgi:hypothetical protein